MVLDHDLWVTSLLKTPKPQQAVIGKHAAVTMLGWDPTNIALCCLPQELLYEDKGGNSVAWNSQFEDMLCFSGNGQMTIKTADFQAHVQKMQGFVVGFKVGSCWSCCRVLSPSVLACVVQDNRQRSLSATAGPLMRFANSMHGAHCLPSPPCLKLALFVPAQGSKVFCLQYVNMATIDIPQGGSMAKYLECNDVKAAYQVACLGVTEADWKALAQAALQVGQGHSGSTPAMRGCADLAVRPLQAVNAMHTAVMLM